MDEEGHMAYLPAGISLEELLTAAEDLQAMLPTPMASRPSERSRWGAGGEVVSEAGMVVPAASCQPGPPSAVALQERRPAKVPLGCTCYRSRHNLYAAAPASALQCHRRRRTLAATTRPSTWLC